MAEGETTFEQTPCQRLEADIAQATQTFEQAKMLLAAQDGYLQGLRHALILLRGE